MWMHYVIQGIFVAGGLLAVSAAVADWEWFFTSHNARFIVKNAGRRRARLFYGVLGGLMVAAGVYFFLAVRGA